VYLYTVGNTIAGVRFGRAMLHEDERGNLVKFLGSNALESLPFEICEVFSSESKAGVVRGMHLQTGQSSNWKVVAVLSGSIYDVLLDLRRSHGGGNARRFDVVSNYMNSESGDFVIIPPGVAHGFQAQTESKILYLSSARNVSREDTGINPLSFGLNWPIGISHISTRDLSLPSLESFL